MTPTDFIERLLRHYAKRHQGDAAEAMWFKEMVSIVDGTDRKVLQRTYELIRDEHDERAFPLPATIRKFIGRASEQLYPDAAATRGHGYVHHGPSKRAPDSPQVVEMNRLANEWQHQMIAKYGSWQEYWRATGGEAAHKS